MNGIRGMRRLHLAEAFPVRGNVMSVSVANRIALGDLDRAPGRLISRAFVS